MLVDRPACTAGSGGSFPTGQDAGRRRQACRGRGSWTGVSTLPRRPLAARAALTLALLVASHGALAKPTREPASELPVEVAAALQRARIPAQALAVVVEEAGGNRQRLVLNAGQPMNPASLAKLVTTYAALDRLGPAWRWRTPVWLAGPVRDGVLAGDLVLRASGDPTLVVERLWLLLRRVQQAGVREIAGNIVLDRRAFAPAAEDPSAFDGEPMRPYNVAPDALMLNFKSALYTFTPDAAAGRARVSATPALAGTAIDASVPLADGGCGDWRGALKASFSDDGRVRFAGRYPAGCGERVWPVADPAPATYNARLLEGLWREMGGTLRGRVRDGEAPAGEPTFVAESPPLAEVVRDINKYSNNTMARQLFLTLAAEADPATPATADAARAIVGAWLRERLGDAAATVAIDNGAGLSRQVRLSAHALARLLQHAWSSPVMPELAASLPAAALDGTLRRASVPAGRAHLKTGSLHDVAGVAGYVLGASGRRWVLVAIVNHPDAASARPALDALMRWTMNDQARR
ncbi:MAG: D-alanyl-D-alanine carboxypeptidase/D-alanyl-D-alanine-endopeptidase [Burkholderiales bacterium]|nr:D-alanyl-D-alanine carboxypeptidase/D-alanyl-D-alanine-endopeptidase [Burkholderiales bacterium]